MLKAIVWKEFRELLPLIVVAITLQTFVVYAIFANVGWRPLHYLHIATATQFLAQLQVLMVVGLGIWQNKAELNQGTFLFLLHRPARREAIVGAKLLAGVCICLLISVLPMAAFAYWAEMKSLASQGKQDSIWTVSSPVCVGIVLIYLGAFMSSLREAAWYKSQFLPLFAAIVLFLMLGILAGAWTPFVLIAMPLLEACFVVAILYEAVTRNYS